MATTASETQVQELYIAYFGRPADPAGLAFYADSLDSGATTVDAIAASFATSTEAMAIIELETDAYLETVYQQAFSRSYNPAEDGTFWADAINNGETTKELAMVQILDGAQGDDKLTVSNKVLASTSFTAALDTPAKVNDYTGDAAQSAKDWLADVSADGNTVIDAVETVNSYNFLNLFTLKKVVNETVTEITASSTVWNDGVDGGGLTVGQFNTMYATITGTNLFELTDATIGTNGGINVGADLSLVDVNIVPADQTAAFPATANDSAVAYTYQTAAGEQFTSETTIALEYVDFLKGIIFHTDPITGDQVSRFTSKEETTEVSAYDVTRVVLTTTQNNGATIEGGNPNDADTLIVAGQTELLHGAYIDAGAGNNTLEVDMKGVYAQPLALLHVQNIVVENLPNVYSSFYDLNAETTEVPFYQDSATAAIIAANTAADLLDAQQALAAEQLLAVSNSALIAILTERVTVATLADLAAQKALSDANAPINPNSILDLTRAIDLNDLVITEGFGTGAALGTLTVVGVRDDATLTLEGSFSQNVNVHYSAGHEDGINLVLNLGNVGNTVFSVAHNSNTLNIDSIGGGNVLQDLNLGASTLIDLNISGDADLFISDSISGAFAAGHPATITTTNTSGVDLNMDGFTDEIIFIGQTDADNHFTADGVSKSVLITDGNGNNEFSAEGSALVNITSGNGNNEIDTDGSALVNITTGTGNDQITSGGSANVTITAAGGNNTINTNGSAIASITTGEGDDTITSVGAAQSITVNAGNGNNIVTVEAETISVTTGAGNDTIVLSNSTANNQGVVAPSDALITVDAGAGTNTILLGTDYQVDTTSPADGVVDAVLVGLTALEGSSITGENITVKVNAMSDLSQATLSGITSVVMEGGATLTLTAAQFTTLGSAVFDVEQDAFTNAAVLNILVTEDATLSDMVALADLVPSISLSFVISDGAELTLSAEELHTYVAPNGISVDDSAVNGYIDNQVIITDASLTFNAFAQQNAGVGAGTINTAVGTNDITIIRSETGYDRPSEDGLDNTWTIDSDVTPVIDINAADGSALTDIDASAVTTLEIVGDADVNFVDSVTLGNDFVIDFSAATGVVSGLTISNFEDINATDFATGGLPLDDEDSWGSITGNGIAGTRVNLEFSAADQTVGYDNNVTGGFKSTGVDTYVVTAISGNANVIHVCDQTDGVTTLGLQSNDGDTITFKNVNWSTTILAQGDGFADWTNLPKELGNPDSSNVGSIIADYFTDGAQAIVNVNNAGVALGVTSTGSVRGLEVDSITVNNANTLTINVEDGNAVINAVAGDSVNSLVVTSAFDVTIQDEIDNLADLEAIDASGVAGTFTLELSNANGVNDLSDVTLAGIDAIVYSDAADLTISVDQALAANISTVVEVPAIASVLNLVDLGTQVLDVTAFDVDDIGTLTIADLATTVVLDAATVLGNGVTAVDSIEISALASATTVEMTAAQYDQIAGNGTFTVDAGTDAATGLDFVATLRVTDIAEDTDIDLTDVNAAIEKTIVLNDTVASDTVVVADKLTITADATEYVTLEVTGGTNDLTNAVITADISNVVFTADATLTLTAAQINAIQVDYVANGGLATTSAFSIENGAVVTLNVIGLDGAAAYDLGLIEDAGINIGTVTTTDANVALDAATTLGGADELIVTSDTADNTLALSAAQYKELADGTITEVDNDATVANMSNVLVTDLIDITTVIENGQGLDENVAEIDLTNVVVTGTKTLELADAATVADVTMSATTILSDFIITLDSQGLLENDLAGQTVRFNTAAQADARDINVINDGGVADNGTNVVWLFNAITGTATAGVVDTASYDANIGRVWMLDTLVDGQNVEELFTTLNDNIIIRVVTIDDLLAVTNPFARTLEIESFVALPNGLTFSDVDAAAPFDFIENLTIDLGGAVALGDIAIDNVISASVNNDDEFDTLTINSVLANADTHYLLPEHFDTDLNPLPSELLNVEDQANTVGDISSGASRDVLKNVIINTNASAAVIAKANGIGGASIGTALNVGTITFVDDGEEAADDIATLLINGTSDVTIAALNTDDADIQNLIVTNTDAAALVITGASPAAAVSNTETLAVNSTDAAGSITFGTAGDADKPGVFGPALSSIITAGAGDIDFGVIADIDGTIDATLSPLGFVMASTSTGDVTLSLGGGATAGAPALGATEAMTFTFAAASTVDMTIASDFTVAAGGALTITNADTLTIDGAVDLSVLGTDLTITGSTIVVAAGDTLTLTAEQADTLVITGAGTVEILDLEDTPLADLSGIMTTAGDTGVVNAAVDTSDGTDADALPEVIELANTLGVAHVTVTGDGEVSVAAGAMTAYNRDADALTDADTVTFTVSDTATLELDADQVGLGSIASPAILVDGTSAVNVNDINLTLAADLSGITTTGAITAAVSSTTAEFTGDLGTATVSIDNTFVLEAQGSVVTGLTIIDTVTDPVGAGTLTIADNVGSTAQDIDLSNVSATNIGFAPAAVLGTVTFPTLRDGNDTAGSITNDQVVTLTSAQADGQTITGAADNAADTGIFIGGVINVSNADAGAVNDAFDLSGLTSGATTISFSTTNTLNAATDLGSATTTTVATTVVLANAITVTMTGAQAAGMTITDGVNSATLELTDLSGGEDLSNITVNAVSGVVTGGTVDLSTVTGLTQIDVEVGANADLTLASDQFTALEAGANTAADLAELTTLTVDVTYTIGANTFDTDLTYVQATDEITGNAAGFVEAKADSIANDGGSFNTNVLANVTAINQTGLGTVLTADSGAAGLDNVADNFVYDATPSAFSTAITVFSGTNGTADGDKVDVSAFGDADNTIFDLTAGTITTTVNTNDVLFAGGGAATDADSAADSALFITSLFGGGVLTETGLNAFYIVSDDNSSALYEYNQGAADGAVLEAELTLIGTITNTNAVLTDFIG